MKTTARRALLGGIAAGGAGLVASAPAAAAGSTAVVPAKRLNVGDLIVGPDGIVVRVGEVKRVSGGRFRIRYTHPTTGKLQPMDQSTDARGYKSTQPFVVLARSVPAAAVLLTAPPSNPDDEALDLPRWKHAKALVASGTRDARLLCVGDSTTAGVGSEGNMKQGGAHSYPRQLARLLGAAGLPAASGLAIPGPDNDNPDLRFAWGDEWGPLPGAGFGWGNRATLRCANTGAAGTAEFTPGEPSTYDRFDIYFLRDPSLGSMDVSVSGGPKVTIDGRGATGTVGTVTVETPTASAGHRVTFTPAGPGHWHLVGVEPWHSTIRRVRVGNAGVGASRTPQWGTDGPWSSLDLIRSYAPDLSVISLGLNDATDGLTTSAYVAALNNVVDACDDTGDAALMSPVPVRSVMSDSFEANVASYTQAMASAGLPYLDLATRWGSGDAAAGHGWFYDEVHPSASGYADVAKFVAEQLS